MHFIVRVRVRAELKVSTIHKFYFSHSTWSRKQDHLDFGAFFFSPFYAPSMHCNGPVVWGVAVCVGLGMCFCKVPVSGQDLRVTIKLSRWLRANK